MLEIKWEQFINYGLPLNNKLSSMTIGVFDGVHRGHQKLINRIVSFNTDNVPIIVTFKDNYKTLNPDLNNKQQKNIYSFQERLIMFEKLGIQITITIDFNEKIKHMPGIEFLDTLYRHGNIGFFAVGSNFRCGYQLDTDAAKIQQYFSSFNIPAETVPEVLYPEAGLEGSLPISSSRIRTAISCGDTELAKKMLESTTPP